MSDSSKQPTKEELDAILDNLAYGGQFSLLGPMPLSPSEATKEHRRINGLMRSYPTDDSAYDVNPLHTHIRPMQPPPVSVNGYHKNDGSGYSNPVDDEEYNRKHWGKR